MASVMRCPRRKQTKNPDQTIISTNIVPLPNADRARPLHCPYINSKFLTRIQPKREDAKFRTKLQVNAHDPSPPHRGVTIYPVKSKVFANYRMQVVAVGVASGMRRSPKPGNRLSGRKRCSSPGPSPADRENKFIKKSNGGPE
ncbi:hypothetical protein NPIL_551731 [Nephila pilipes]|uniref:Uncharacterized protein n=1 Tax=Nephila pilipes TaxID=299642 RepID=A0A8X6TYD3_NEPPI|nr:hypothetical protein NPIL_551731 [Nephila pilipes]